MHGSQSVQVDERLRGLRGRWTLAFVIGELIGFLPPAIVGAALAATSAPDPVLILALTGAGALEGAALGLTQSLVLRTYAPRVDRARWVVATAAAAAFAWFVGMSGPALFAADLVPVPVTLAIMVPAWCAAAAAIGFAQWLVLRESVAHSTPWIPVNAIAWVIGVMIPVAALSLAPDGWPLWSHVVVAVAAAVAMGVTVGTLTARTLRRLLKADGIPGQDPGS